MIGAVVPVLVGIICIVLGLQNRKGNIESLHAYHRSRVSQEDRLAFGKAVGNGTIIIGVSVILMGIFLLIAELTQTELYALLGTGLMIAGMIPGFVVTFKAMIKYNKGIF